ncbi:uncharacterized protein LOC131954027 [Physella acuta]|uniref:uncharacterized protein LOC131954027 n=1 Tax=Physella acuta TaxID=109671 RepID=UPI0027DD0F0F|nr:uncharacterized protein LOC131954027 [Physella acuta]
MAESTTQMEADVGGLIDEGTYHLIILVCFVITLIISPLGIIFNIINIVVFCKLGFKESTNIILVSLSVTDMCMLLTVLGMAFSTELADTSSDDCIDAVNLIILALCVLTIAYSFPIYLANSIGLRFNPMSNQTSVGLIVAENSDVLEGVSISLNGGNKCPYTLKIPSSQTVTGSW